MTTVEVKCPTCSGTQVCKYGKSKNGTQRYLCCTRECPRNTFRLEYRYEGSKPGIEEKIIAMAANASGIRDTARVLGISTDKVMDTLKKRKNLWSCATRVGFAKRKPKINDIDYEPKHSDAHRFRFEITDSLAE